MPLTDEGQSISELAGLLATGKGGGDAGGVEAGDTVDEDQGDEQPGDTPDSDEGDGGNSDEGTGADDAEGSGDEPNDDEDGEPSAEPFYTVKIDGKEERVTLKEALAGYQRQADYTRKTQEVAARQAAAETASVEAQKQRDAYAQVLQVVKDRLGPESGERTADQWNALRAHDPTAYAAEWTDFQRRVEQRNAVKAEEERLASEKRAGDANRLREFVEGERVKLYAAMPVLKDPVKGPEAFKAIREYAMGRGFTEAEVNQVYDHRMLVLVNDARQWQDHQAALARAKTKVKAAPTLPEPGARQAQGSSKERARAKQMKTFQQTGRIEDAVSLLLK